jgi:hypothetical protein
MNDVLENHIGLTTAKDATTNDQFVDVKQVAPCLSESSEAPAPEQLRGSARNERTSPRWAIFEHVFRDEVPS